MSKKTKALIFIFTLSLVLISGCARKTPEKLMNDAYEAAHQMDYLTAIIKLDDFLERYPNHPGAIEAQFHKGDIYVAQGRFDQAITEYQKVIDKYPVSNELNVGAKFAIVDCYLSQKKQDKAAEILQKINDDKSLKSNMKAQFTLAAYYVKENKWDKAQEIWQNIATDTTQAYASVIARYNLAKSYEDQKQWTKAEKTYREILTLLPLPQTKGFPKDFAKSKSEEMMVNVTQDIANLMYKSGKTQQAVTLYESLQNKYPENEFTQGIGDWTNVKIGDIYKETKQPKKAQEYYEKAIATYAKITSDPLLPDKAAWAAARMGEIYELHVKDTTKALSIYQNAVKTYAKTHSVQYAQAGLARMTHPRLAKDTTQGIIPTSPLDTTKKK